MNWLVIVGLVIVGIIVIIIIAGSLISGNAPSYLATGSQIMSPDRAPIGKALVVYDPGVSGAAKNAAVTLAGDLRSNGYTVNLAGIRSTAAANVSGYGVIVVGGPTYGGATSRSVTAFLKAVTPPNDAKMGIFATGGVTFNNTIPWYEQDRLSIGDEVSDIWSDKSLSNAVAIKIVRNGEMDKDCRDFVADLLGRESRA